MIASPLRTPRLALVPMVEAHAEDLWRSIESSLGQLRPWMSWAADSSPVTVAEFVVRSEQAWLAGERWTFTVTHRDEACGTVGIDTPDEINSSAKIGYWLRSDLAGQGLMTEAASAAAAFAFDDLGFHRLELHAAVENRGSRRVAEKLGFREEGLLRDGSKGTEGFLDAIVYGLLSTDPRPRFHLGAKEG
ncbi:MAG: GNAT family N-acetyltransferase [Actinobacteria bacterium]|nr:GNAT family N-acetyltransferase [Actinomycetota bacterium]